MKKIITCFIAVTMLSLPVSSWAGKEKNLNLDSGSAGSKSKFSAVKKAVVLAPVTLLVGGVLNVVNNLQKTQPPVAAKKQLLAKFKDYKSKLPKDLTQQEQIDAFIKEKYAEIYLDLMKNIDSKHGPVLWGGDVEIAAIVLKYKIGIRVIDNDKGTDRIHGEKYKTKIAIKRQGNHYKYIDVFGQDLDVPADGNCMFTAILKAVTELQVEMFPQTIVDLRNEVVGYIENNPDLKNNIVPDNDSNGEKVDGKHTLEEILNDILNNFQNNNCAIGHDCCKHMTQEKINTVLDKLATNQLTGVEKEKAEAVLLYETQLKNKEKNKEMIKKKYELGEEYRKTMTDEEVSVLLDKCLKKQLTGIEQEKAKAILFYEKQRKKYELGRNFREKMTDEEVTILLDKLIQKQLTGIEQEKAEAVLLYEMQQKNNEKSKEKINKKYILSRELSREYGKTMADEEVKVLLDKFEKNQLDGPEKEKVEAILVSNKKINHDKKYQEDLRKKYELGRKYRETMSNEEVKILLDNLAKNSLIGVEKQKAEYVLFYEKKEEYHEKTKENSRKKYMLGRDYCKSMTDEEVKALLDDFVSNKLTGVEQEKAEHIFFYKNKIKFYEKRNDLYNKKYVLGRGYYKSMTKDEVKALLGDFVKNKLTGVEKEKAEVVWLYDNRQKKRKKYTENTSKKYHMGKKYCNTMTYEEKDTLLDKLAKNQLIGVEKEKAEAVFVYDRQKKRYENIKKKYVIGRNYCKSMTDEEVKSLLDDFVSNKLTDVEKEKAKYVFFYKNKEKLYAKQKENNHKKYMLGKDCCKSMTDEEVNSLLDDLMKNKLIGFEKEKAQAVFYYKKQNNKNKKSKGEEFIPEERVSYLNNKIDQGLDESYDDYENYGYGEDEDEEEYENDSEDLVDLVREFLLRNNGVGL